MSFGLNKNRTIKKRFTLFPFHYNASTVFIDLYRVVCQQKSNPFQTESAQSDNGLLCYELCIERKEWLKNRKWDTVGSKMICESFTNEFLIVPTFLDPCSILKSIEWRQDFQESPIPFPWNNTCKISAASKFISFVLNSISLLKFHRKMKWRH